LELDRVGARRFDGNGFLQAARILAADGDAERALIAMLSAGFWVSRKLGTVAPEWAAAYRSIAQNSNSSAHAQAIEAHLAAGRESDS
jgi:hypothetical protein